jgi:transposase-like protein
MEAGSTSETSINFYGNTRRNTPEDSHLHIRRRENLKSHLKHNVSITKINWLMLFKETIGT